MSKDNTSNCKILKVITRLLYLVLFLLIGSFILILFSRFGTVDKVFLMLDFLERNGSYLKIVGVAVISSCVTTLLWNKRHGSCTDLSQKQSGVLGVCTKESDLKRDRERARKIARECMERNTTGFYSE